MMIKIIAKNYSQTVKYLCNQLDNHLAQYDVLLLQDKQSTLDAIAKKDGSKAVILVGNVGQYCNLVAETFGLSMFYDTFAERSVKEFCKLTKQPLPTQFALDSICVAPESFNHFPCVFGYQCACYGECNGVHYYVTPDDLHECEMVYEQYFVKDVFKGNNGGLCFTYKLFGLTKKEVETRCEKLNKIVSRKCETINLDTKVQLTFSPRCAKSVVEQVVKQFESLFSDSIYARCDQSLAKTVVETLKSVNKTLSLAESITGGMIASSIVDVAGSSSVLYESVVTYSVASKCARLGLNPHFIDEYGVVSQQVAQQMAQGLRSNGTDIALGVTGFAGPTAEQGLPVGLCYIGISSQKGVFVYKNVFTGNRNVIRAQVTNMALFLIYKTVAN